MLSLAFGPHQQSVGGLRDRAHKTEMGFSVSFVQEAHFLFLLHRGEKNNLNALSRRNSPPLHSNLSCWQKERTN
jgi:hypothetical protein